MCALLCVPRKRREEGAHAERLRRFALVRLQPRRVARRGGVRQVAPRVRQVFCAPARKQRRCVSDANISDANISSQMRDDAHARHARTRARARARASRDRDVHLGVAGGHGVARERGRRGHSHQVNAARRKMREKATDAHHQHRCARERRMHTAQQRRLRCAGGAPVALWVHQVRCCPAPRALSPRRVVQEAAHNLAALLLVRGRARPGPAHGARRSEAAREGSAAEGVWALPRAHREEAKR